MKRRERKSKNKRQIILDKESIKKRERKKGKMSVCKGVESKEVRKRKKTEERERERLDKHNR